MSYFITGLGNPGEEYALTRHNVGRIVLEHFATENDFSEFKENKSAKVRVATGSLGKTTVTLVEPDNYMNRSGPSLIKFLGNPKKSKNLIVIHDDLDLPLGSLKISWNRGPGGHKGVASIIKVLKTEAFTRIRVGISPVVRGTAKKPTGGAAVEKHILGEFKKPELSILKKVSKTASEAIEAIIKDGPQIAMGKFN